LFFGDHQILWKCDSSRKSEAFGEGILWNYGPVMETPAGDIQKRIQLKPGAMVGELVHAWSLLLRTYTRRDLTHSSDKLVAMAGLAEHFENLTGDKYVAGHWKCYLKDDLLWKTSLTARGERKPLYRAPTWSWASDMGKVVRTTRSTTGSSSTTPLKPLEIKEIIKILTSDRYIKSEFTLEWLY
jgi:hypothetical protein